MFQLSFFFSLQRCTSRFSSARADSTPTGDTITTAPAHAHTLSGGGPRSRTPRGYDGSVPVQLKSALM